MRLRPARYTARWLLPISSAPVQDGALLVGADGRIAAVGPDAAVPCPADAEAVPLGDAALLPGLVNVHAHPELAGFRGLLEDLPFHEWIPTLNRIKREAAPEPADYEAAARWTCIEALAAGITTLAATEDTAAGWTALHEAGLRGILYQEVFGPAPEQAEASMTRLRASVDALRAGETELVRVGVSPHAVYTVSDPLFRACADYARAEQLPIAVHAAEAATEELLVRAGDGPFAAGLRARGIPTPPRARSTIALLDQLGVLQPQTLLIHCLRLDGEDLRRIAASGAAVAHCPIANARLGHGIAPIPELLELGIRVGLGTDSVASNNRIDLLEEARTAQLVQRARLHDATVLPAERLLRLATSDGARALGLDSRVGTLEAGKDADLCAVSLAGVHVRPVHDPAAALVHAARATDVILTAVRGRVLCRDGAVLSLDAAAVRDRLESFAQRLSAARRKPA